MSTLASLQILLGMDSRGLTTGVAQAQGQISKFGAGAQRSLGTVVPLSATLASVAIGKFALDSFKAARDFDKAFGQIAAISNATAQDIEQWRGEVMELGGETAKSPVELAEALFFLSSAGIDSGKVMGVLDKSARAAAVGLGSTVDVAKITANALNAYADAGLTAAQVTDTLVAAVREGSAEPEEFAAALGRILPIASQAGIEFNEVTASLAALSNIGLDVNEGVTAMRGLMTALVAPTKQTQDAMKSLGLSADEVRRSLAEDGLIATLRMLEERTGGNIDMMKQLVPNVRALSGVFGLTSQEAAKVDAIINNVLNSSGSLAEAWRELAENDAFKLERAINKIQIEGQKLAAQVLPFLASGMGFVAENIELVVAAFAVWLGMRALPAFIMAISHAMFALSVKLLAVGGAASVAGAGMVKASMNLAMLARFGNFAAIAIGFAAFAIMQASAEAARQRQVIAEWTAALLDGTLVVAQLHAQIEGLKRDAPDWADDILTGMEETAVSAAVLTAALAPLGEGLVVVGATLQEVADGPVQRLATEIEETAQRVKNFANMTDEEFKEFKDNAVESIQGVVGSLTGFERKWDLTSRQAARAMEQMVEKSREMRRAYDELDRTDVQPRFREWIINQGPSAVVAFTKLSKEEQDKFVRDWRKVDANVRDAIGDLPAKLMSDGEAAGRNFGLGLGAGLDSTMPFVEARARALAAAAVAAAERELGEESASKVMHKVGVNFALGFANGIRDGLTDVISAIKDVVGEGLSKAHLLQAKELEAMADDIAGHLERLQGKISDFKDAIRSGMDLDLIGGLLDLEALNLGTIQEDLQHQLALAKAFAQSLKQLQALGLDPRLLADIASRGPDAMPLVQALLEGGQGIIDQFNETQRAINAITEHLTTKLVDEIFGDKLKKAGDAAAELAERVAEFVKAIRAVAVRREMDEVISGLRHLARILNRVGVNVPGFARGGLHAGGLAITGEAGPEVGVWPAHTAFTPLSRLGDGIDYDRLAGAVVDALREGEPVHVPVAWADDVGARAETFRRRRKLERERL